MKRRPAMQQLSRDHYGALKLAREARHAAGSGDANEIATLAQRVVECFAAELEPHFRIEEEELLPALTQACELERVRRTHADHAELRRLAGLLATPDPAVLLRFGDLLAAHVRFEERELFEVAQAKMAS